MEVIFDVLMGMLFGWIVFTVIAALWQMDNKDGDGYR